MNYLILLYANNVAMKLKLKSFFGFDNNFKIYMKSWFIDVPFIILMYWEGAHWVNNVSRFFCNFFSNGAKFCTFNCGLTSSSFLDLVNWFVNMICLRVPAFLCYFFLSGELMILFVIGFMIFSFTMNRFHPTYSLFLV